MLGSSILVSLATLLVSATSFLSQVVLAWRFGASSTMDIYLLAVSVPMFISAAFSVSLSYSLVPALLSYHPQPDSFRQISGILFIIFFLLAVLIASLGSLVTPWQIAILGTLLSNQEITEAIQIARVSWMTAGVMVLIAYLRGLHNAKQRFLLATFSSTVPPVCVIFAGLLATPNVGPIFIAWAMLFGFVLLVPLLLFHSYSDLNLSYTSLRAFPTAKNYLIRLPLIILAVLCFIAFQVSDAFWASHLVEGNLAQLGYVQRLVVSLGNLVIAGPAAVILPKLSMAHSEGRSQDLLADVLRVIRMVLACALPVAVCVSVLAQPTVHLLFERGAFDQYATGEVSILLPWMMLGMVPMLCVVVIFRAIFARQEVLWAAGIGVCTSILYFILSGLLAQSFGALGIALAYSCTWWIIFIVSMGVLWRGKLSQLTKSDNGKFIGKLSIVLALTAALGLASNGWISHPDATQASVVLRLCLVGFISALLYVCLAVLIQIEEIRLLFFYMLQKLGLDSKLFGGGRP
jgi:putative peptidoglycan lipid II flippase